MSERWVRKLELCTYRLRRISLSSLAILDWARRDAWGVAKEVAKHFPMHIGMLFGSGCLTEDDYTTLREHTKDLMRMIEDRDIEHVKHELEVIIDRLHDAIVRKLSGEVR